MYKRQGQEWASASTTQARRASLNQAPSGKVGTGRVSEPAPRAEEQSPGPKAGGGTGNRADSGSHEAAESEELVRLRALTQELSANINDLARLGEADPEELETLLRNTLQYLSARQAALQRRRARNAAECTWAPLEEGTQSSRFCEWNTSTASRVDEAERLLLENAVTPETLRKYISLFNHYRVFLHNYYGPNVDPLITDASDPEAERRIMKFVGYLYQTGVMPSTAKVKLSAIGYFHEMNGLGQPLRRMGRLRKLLRAFVKLRGESIPAMRLSQEFMTKAMSNRYSRGTLLDLCLLSCYVMGWFAILRSQNYVTNFLTPEVVDTKVTLTDGDVEIHHKGSHVPLDRMTRDWLKTVKVSELSALLSFGGGKTSPSGWQRWIYPTGIPALEPVLAIAHFIIGRNETGVGTNPSLPFHRVGPEPENFLTYTALNSGLKDDGELQGLLREWVKSHGLRGGGAVNAETALGGSTLQSFGNWRSECYRRYRNEALLHGHESFAAKMASVKSTNAQSQRELQLRLNARKALETNTASVEARQVRGAALEGELLAEIGNTWHDDNMWWRLVSVSTHALTTVTDGVPALETHVIGVYVNHLKYPNAEAAPPGDLEWSTAAELLVWLRQSRAHSGEELPGELGETA